MHLFKQKTMKILHGSFAELYVLYSEIQAVGIHEWIEDIRQIIYDVGTVFDPLYFLLTGQLYDAEYKIRACLNCIIYQMQEQLIKTAAHVDYSSFDEPRFYDAMEFALREANGLTKSIESFLSIFSAIINFVTALVLCLQYDWLLPMILIVGIFPYYFMRNKLDKYTYDVSAEINALGRKTSALRHLLISKYYAHEVRSFDLFNFLIS